MFGRLLRERRRGRAVARLGEINVSAEPGFDRILEQAASAFSAPIALLTILDNDKLRIVAAQGMQTQCVSRKDAFCNYAVDRKTLLEICDATRDPAFRRLPLVSADPHVRYYIGAPLKIAEGAEIGTLCVLDTTARAPASPDQRAYLASLARQATGLLERNAHLRGRIVA